MMHYKVYKELEIAASHKLNLPYESACGRRHGHNWIIKVHCASQTLDKNGMVVDFTHIKQIVHGTMDHQEIDKIFDFNTTAENIAKWIVDNVDKCYKAEVWESKSNYASFEIPLDYHFDTLGEKIERKEV